MPENKTLLLMGPPNVGKSVIFNRLTGLNVCVANYVGTTVEYASGNIDLGGERYTLVDVPGTYSLEATCEAEAVAVEMLRGKPGQKVTGHCSETPGAGHAPGTPEAVVCVIDANNLESSLYLLMQLLQEGLPVVAALNRGDLAQQKGHRIDAFSLSRELGIPVIPTVAVSGKGIPELKEILLDTVKTAENKTPPQEKILEADWKQVEELCQKVLQVESQRPFLRWNWDKLLTSPWPGLPLALLILGLVFLLVVGAGMGLRQYVLLPVFEGLLFPHLKAFVSGILPTGTLQNILIGEYGFLIKGIEWPFALVLPYVISFYFALGLLEDSGYMPRLAVLLDGLLNRIGLPGTGVIPLLLGYGCAIPAILASRSMNTQKERTILTVIVCLTVPCISQTGALIALLYEHSPLLVPALVALAVLSMIGTGFLLNSFLKGGLTDTLMEIPELLLPRGEVIIKKVWARIKHYLVDGALPMIGAVALAAFLYETGIMAYLGNLLSPLVVNWLGLPGEAAIPLVLGVLRRELAVLPLLELELTTLQIFVGAAVGLFYVPCIAVIAVLVREFRFSFAAFILLLTTAGAFLIGGLLLRLGSLFV